jgi:hypothetical protein
MKVKGTQRHVMALKAIRRTCDLLRMEDEDRTGTDQGVFPGSEPPVPVSFFGPDGDFHPLVIADKSLDDWTADVVDWALQDEDGSMCDVCGTELDADDDCGNHPGERICQACHCDREGGGE